MASAALILYFRNDLYIAAFKKDYTYLTKALLKVGADPFSFFWYAFKKNNIGDLKIWLQKGSNPNSFIRSHSLLYHAITANALYVMKILLDYQADPNGLIEEAKEGNIVDMRTALEYAIAQALDKKNSLIARVLIAYTTDLSHINVVLLQE
jgi:ankyrin repeat protein